jgi:hypothetical protein
MVSAAENGGRPNQPMAIFGGRTTKEAERYTKAAQQKERQKPTLLAAGGEQYSRAARYDTDAPNAGGVLQQTCAEAVFQSAELMADCAVGEIQAHRGERSPRMR